MERIPGHFVFFTMTIFNDDNFWQSWRTSEGNEHFCWEPKSLPNQKSPPWRGVVQKFRSSEKFAVRLGANRSTPQKDKEFASNEIQFSIFGTSGDSGNFGGPSQCPWNALAMPMKIVERLIFQKLRAEPPLQCPWNAPEIERRTPRSASGVQA